MILVDFSGLAIATIVVNKVDDENLLRHMVLNSLRMYRNSYKDKFGELVLCCDGKNNWRRSYYPQYKAVRKKKRQESDFDWDKAFGIMNDLREELLEHFPYKLLHVDECEADDIIGTLCENTQEFGQYEDVMIISADKDFLQLQRYPNVRQYSPLLKKEYKEDAPLVGLMEKVLTGDAGDGVPNVLSDDDVFVDGRRQTPLSKKKKEAMKEDLADGELLYAASWYRNYQRNETLIDLSKTPQRLKDQIIEKFNSQDQLKNKSLVFPYLINKNMKMLIESVEEFIN
jgi:superoxide dismutase